MSVRVSPFRITVSITERGRYRAIARTDAGDFTAYGSTHFEAFCRVLASAWRVSIIQ